jgi:sugar phosphate isomerase/epimerase
MIAMRETPFVLDRRQFTRAAAAGAAAFLAPRALRAAEDAKPYKFCAFIKFLQSLSYSQLADAMAEAGFDGVEVTARKNESYIEPDRADEQLPKFVEELSKRGLEITILTTDLLRADEPHAERLLRTAAELGVARYRLGFFRYDLKRPVLPQLTQLQPVMRDFAAMNRELGIAAVYQNHSGADMVGATFWDLHSLIKDYPVTEIGSVFDIRHATVEGGEAWPVYWNLMQPHVGALSVKDFRWNGRKSQHVPLGTGQVDPRFFKMVEQSDFSGPISVHVEYAGEQSAAANVALIRKDFATLRKWLA